MRGDLLFVQGSSWVSRLIQWRTHGPYDHVAIDLGSGVQLGAEPEGIKARPLAELGPSDALLRVSLGLSPAWWAKGYTFLGQFIDSGYSAADILDDLFPSWLPLRLLFAQTHAYDCSDLVARYLDELGIIPLAELGGDAKTVTPNDLYRACKRKGLL